MRDPHRTTTQDRGAAAVEYILMLMVLVLGVTVGLNEFEHGVESEAAETAADISGDPAGSSSTTTSEPPGSTSSTTTGTVPVNQPPIVDVPDLTQVPVDPGELNPFTLRTTVTDDFTPLDVMGIAITITSGLGGDGSYIIDPASPGAWIEHDHTAPNPGVYYVTVCAHDGLVETCDTGTVKVSTGTVHVDTDLNFSGYSWNGSYWYWQTYSDFWVRDVGGGLVGFDDVSVDFTVEMVYDEGAGEQTVAYNQTCSTGTDGHCRWWSPTAPADAVRARVWVTDVRGVCVDGWDGDPSEISLESDLGEGPGSPPTTTSSTTTIPSSSTTGPTTTTMSSSTTNSTTTPPTTTTVITTTTFDDDT